MDIKKFNELLKQDAAISALNKVLLAIGSITMTLTVFMIITY